MKFSLLCPTRKRLDGLYRLLDSLVYKTKNHADIELLLAYDLDDIETKNFFERNFKPDALPFKVRFFGRERSPMLNEAYYNMMAFQSKGDYLWAIGDDTEIMTQNWDEILIHRINQFKEITKYKDNVLYIATEDSTPPPPGARNPPPFCCFPIVSREAVNVLGFFLHSNVATWGADATLYDVYSNPRVNRILNVPEVVINHISHHNGSVPRDQVNFEIEANFRKSENAEKLKRVQQTEVPHNVNILVAHIIAANSVIDEEQPLPKFDLPKVEVKNKNAKTESIIKEMQKYYAEIRNYGIDLGCIWETNVRHLDSLLLNATTVSEVLESVSDHDYYSINRKEEARDKMIDWYYDYMVKYHKYDIQKAPPKIHEPNLWTNPVQTKMLGRNLTPAFMFKLILYLRMQDQMPVEGFKTILEIGAGNGTLGRIFKIHNPELIYIDIDIPQSLCVAYVYLKASNPKWKILLVKSEQDCDDISKYDIVLCPTVFANRVLPKHKIDLVCNTASMGEMNNNNIRGWMNYIQNMLDVKYFYGLNRYLNTMDPNDDQGKRRPSENECSVLFDRKWDVLAWELEPPQSRCTTGNPIEARYLELMLRRRESDDQAAVAKSVKNLALVKCDDWFVTPVEYVHGKNRYNILCRDMTMSSTLFLLWNAIRLNPTKEAVLLMIKYLTTLTIDNKLPFEEMYYYEKLIDTLLV